MSKGTKRVVPVKGTSPKVSKDATSGFKYSTDSKGRNSPPGLGKRVQKKTNP